MAGETTGEKRFLNYQGATFKRSLIYLGLALVMYLACFLIKFKSSVPPPGEVAGPSMAKILMGFAAVCLTLSAIIDAIFVLYQNFLRTKQFAFDQENLYIIRRDRTEEIPLRNIYQIALASTRIQNGPRGYYDYYRISFNSYGEEKDFVITIYARMRENFDDLRKLVKEKNPSVDIKNWATSVDWIFRLFKKTKPQHSEDLFK
jgi:hypothetical protein